MSLTGGTRGHQGWTRVIFPLAAALFFALACRPPEMQCPLRLVSPISLEIREDASRMPAAQGTTVTFRNRGQSAIVRPTTPGQFVVVAPGGPGTYTVLVQKTGYEDWTRSAVRVPGNQCGVVKTVVLKADIKRVSHGM